MIVVDNDNSSTCINTIKKSNTMNIKDAYAAADIRVVAGMIASQQIKKMEAKSKLIGNGEEESGADVQKVSSNDIKIDSILGMGGFSTVYKASILNDDAGAAEAQSNKKNKRKHHYALKCLNAKTKHSRKTFTTGALDLAMEAYILSKVAILCKNERGYDNIIRLHGVSAEDIRTSFLSGNNSPGSHNDIGYFLLLDVLQQTLSDRLERWRKRLKAKSMTEMKPTRPTKQEILHRVKHVAIGVASGLGCLSKLNIALRDLKPDNIGFDENLVPKLFDFGFAREIHTIPPKEMAGSLRYMSPENALGLGIDTSTDVYSFGVLLWELCTLQKPFQKFTSHDEFMRVVIQGNWRPAVVTIPIPAIQQLIERCWDAKRSNRPTFPEIIDVLENVVNTNGDATIALANSLSTASLHDSGLSLSSSIHNGKEGRSNMLKKRPSLKNFKGLGRSSSTLGLNATTHGGQFGKSSNRLNSSSNLFKTIRSSFAMSSSSLNGSGFFNMASGGRGSSKDFHNPSTMPPSSGGKNATWGEGTTTASGPAGTKPKRRTSLENKIKNALLAGSAAKVNGGKNGNASFSVAEDWQSQTQKQRQLDQLRLRLQSNQAQAHQSWSELSSAAGDRGVVGSGIGSGGNQNATWNMGNQMRAKSLLSLQSNGELLGNKPRKSSKSHQDHKKNKITTPKKNKAGRGGLLWKQNSIPELAYSGMDDDDDGDDDSSFSLDMSDLKDDNTNENKRKSNKKSSSAAAGKSSMSLKQKFHSSLSSFDGF